MILLSGTVRIRLVVKRRPRRSARRRRWRPRLARPNAPGSHASRPFWVFWGPVPRPGRALHHSQSQAIRQSCECQIEAVRATAHACESGIATGPLRAGRWPKGALRHGMPHHGMARPRRLSLSALSSPTGSPGPTSLGIAHPESTHSGPTSLRADSPPADPRAGFAPGRLTPDGFGRRAGPIGPSPPADSFPPKSSGQLHLLGLIPGRE